MSGIHVLKQQALLLALSLHAHASLSSYSLPFSSPLINHFLSSTLQHSDTSSPSSLLVYTARAADQHRVCVGTAAQVRCPTTGACLVPGASPRRRLHAGAACFSIFLFLVFLLVFFSPSPANTPRALVVSSETRQKAVDFQGVYPRIHSAMAAVAAMIATANDLPLNQTKRQRAGGAGRS